LKSDREAGALQNAEERTKSFPYPLRVKTSTPTTSHGEIWKEFKLGDQRYFFVPCPHCATKIRLMWEQVKWWTDSENESKTDGTWDDEKVRRNTHYICQECGGKILDSQKTVMLRGGEWRATADRGLVGRRGYHLNSLYAPLKEAQWGLLAVKWLQSKGSISRRQAFINSTLAEPWDSEKAVDDDPINLRAYAPADLPGDRIPVMTVDVQENHFWVVVRDWGNPKAADGQETWLRFADRVETSEEVEKLANDYHLDPRRVGVDMAHRPNMVSALLEKNDWRGLWGSSKDGFIHNLGRGFSVTKEYSKVQHRDPHLGTIQQSESNRKAMYVYWSNDRIKDRLEVLRAGGRWHVMADVTKVYVHQLNSEIKTTKVSATGKVSYFYKQVRKDNHLRDCEAMQIVMALAGGILEDAVERAASAQGVLAIEPEHR
jgi:DNA-directed RNA polymerase subunit RPC12/RpoP